MRDNTSGHTDGLTHDVKINKTSVSSVKLNQESNNYQTIGKIHTLCKLLAVILGINVIKLTFSINTDTKQNHFKLLQCYTRE